MCFYLKTASSDNWNERYTMLWDSGFKKLSEVWLHWWTYLLISSSALRHTHAESQQIETFLHRVDGWPTFAAVFDLLLIIAITVPWSLASSPGCCFFLNVIVTQITQLWGQCDACECSRGGVSSLRNLLGVSTSSLSRFLQWLLGCPHCKELPLGMALANPSCPDHVLEKEGFFWETQQSQPFEVYRVEFSKWN